MVKMRARNEQLKNTLGAMAPKERIVEANNIPQEDTVNRQGYKAYSLSDEIRLVAMLNTCKLESQYYRSENETLRELRDLIERLCVNGDAYFVCQAIVWSRCLGEGMRDVNNIAAALVAPFISGMDYAKRFYAAFDKKKKQGGCIYRLDDMVAIKDVYNALNDGVVTNAMKKGFAKVLENADTYTLAKYRKVTIDMSNLVRPNPKNSQALVKVSVEGKEKEMKTLDAIMQGIVVSADTWEVANTEAGQEVAKAVREGKLNKDEAEKVLTEAKNENWKELLTEGRLGILAALRNIRNILKGGDDEVIKLLCNLVSNGEKIVAGKIMPYQIDTAYEILNSEFGYHKSFHKISQALIDGYNKSVPNLKAALPGVTCVALDCSGSMTSPCIMAGSNGQKRILSSALDKAALIAATIALATGADIIRFGRDAHYYKYNKNTNPFALAKELKCDMGGTCIGSVFELMREQKRKYDRVVLLSDNECNRSTDWYGRNWVKDDYKKYVHDVTSPYVYCIDFCAYGTIPLKNDGKVNYYFGYGYAMFNDITTREFNPEAVMDKIRAVVI